MQLIGSYTGEGVLFTVDTRLRPNGNAGSLVQTEVAVLDYFIHTAEAWESITYLKARVVAGESKRAERFLHDLQQAYGDRYGQAGNSRLDLREMRARLEREQGSSKPLKAGRGGYYDIDFLLLYLRLKNAGVYYSYLNTIARVEVLETAEKAEPLRCRAVTRSSHVLSGAGPRDACFLRPRRIPPATRRCPDGRTLSATAPLDIGSADRPRPHP